MFGCYEYIWLPLWISHPNLGNFFTLHFSLIDNMSMADTFLELNTFFLNLTKIWGAKIPLWVKITNFTIPLH